MFCAGTVIDSIAGRVARDIPSLTNQDGNSAILTIGLLSAINY